MSEVEKAKRARASERAVTIALRAAKAEGLMPTKITVEGARIEIHFGDPAIAAEDNEDYGLEKW